MGDGKNGAWGSLAGVRVLDLTRILAGPYCTQVLVDHGAEVIKVEKPGEGDDTRAFGPPFLGGESTYFMSINHGKRSLAVDMKHPDGLALVRELALRSDVVVENFRPGAAARLGLGPDELTAANPRLVYCSISGYGQDGPWRDRPGYDLAVQGLSGLQSLNGEPDGPPVKVGTSIADLVSGLYAAQGILLALFRRERTGEGDVVDVGMMDAVVSLLTYQAATWFAEGRSPRRAGNRHPSIVPYETFPTSNGWLNLAVGNDKLFQKLAEVLGRPDLASDARYRTNPARVANRDALAAVLEDVFRTRPTAEWTAVLAAAGVPAGPILSVGEALETDVLRARDMVVTLEHPKAGPIRTTGVPVKLRNAPGAVCEPPPLLGQHTREVLRSVLGWSDADVDRAVAAGVVAEPAPGPGTP